MTETLVTELERFAAALIETQRELLDILRRKRTALSASDLDALEALRMPESDAAQRLQSLVAWRTKLLEASRLAGKTHNTLIDLAQSLRDGRTPELVSALQSARTLATELQRESWVHWVITNRCCHFYGQLLELIAHGGKKPPTYQSSDWVRRGGVVLNASA
jgi:hypothetical protein